MKRMLANVAVHILMPVVEYRRTPQVIRNWAFLTVIKICLSGWLE